MTTPTVPVAEPKSDSSVPSAPKRTRRTRNAVDDNLRFFLGKANASSGHPELGEEAPDENQALIKAFQQTGVIYVIHTYRVDAEVHDGIPTLVKRPLVRQQE